MAGPALDEVRFQAQLLGAVEVLADDLGLVEGPLIGGLLLGEQHLLRRVVAAQRRDGEDDGEDGGDERDAPAEPVLGALVQLLGVRELDLRHPGLDARPPLRDLVAHRRPPRLEGGDEPVGLLLEILAALLEEVAGLDPGPRRRWPWRGSARPPRARRAARASRAPTWARGEGPSPRPPPRRGRTSRDSPPRPMPLRSSAMSLSSLRAASGSRGS